MTGVFDDETNIVLVREVHTSDSIRGLGDLDGIAGVGSDFACARLRGEGIAALVLEIRCYDGGG